MNSKQGLCESGNAISGPLESNAPTMELQETHAMQEIQED